MAAERGISATRLPGLKPWAPQEDHLALLCPRMLMCKNESEKEQGTQGCLAPKVISVNICKVRAE